MASSAVDGLATGTVNYRMNMVVAASHSLAAVRTVVEAGCTLVVDHSSVAARHRTCSAVEAAGSLAEEKRSVVEESQGLADRVISSLLTKVVVVAVARQAA